MEFKKAISYEINISPTPNNGFIVKVGCATLAFSDWRDLINALTEYFKDPEGVEKEYQSKIQPSFIVCGNINIGS